MYPPSIGVATTPLVERHPETAVADQRVRTPVEQAVIRTVAYADVFDHPLDAAETHRYLVGLEATPAAVREELERLVPELLTEIDGFYMLRGRSHLVETRRVRTAAAARLWPRAVRYGRVLAQLPFVRMVAVTGSLTRDNADARGDIDYLVVTEAGRVWVVRALTGVVRRAARRRGTRLCINYVLSEEALSLADRNLFTACEVAQMVPLTGHGVYDRLRGLNDWTGEFLPNAGGRPRSLAQVTPSRDKTVRLAEAALATRIGRWIERFERARFERKLPRRTADTSEVVYSHECFKDHVDSWGERVLVAYAERVAAMGAEA